MFSPSLIDLGVNIDHIATLRNVRNTPYPNLIQFALLAEEAGADLITLHLREDRRHIRDADVELLRAQIKTRMNLEAAISTEMLEIIARIRPHDVCFVPEKREERTTEAGLDLFNNVQFIKQACQQCTDLALRVSLFIDPDLRQIDAAKALNVAAIELHTGAYAQASQHYAEHPDQIAQTLLQKELDRLKDCVQHARALGLKVNAGHGLHFDNAAPIAAIEGITELNIGHALVAYALFVGWEKAVREMKALITRSRLAVLRQGLASSVV